MERKRGTTGKITNGRIVDALRKHCNMAMRFDPDPLNHARKIRGLTLADLAKRINKSTATVSMVLAGKVCAVKTVFALCAELGVPTAKVWR
jgi:antitoxin component HigA of HigAB toxin-antitoxin module